MISVNSTTKLSTTKLPDSERSERLRSKLRDWGLLLIAGRLSGDHLRRVELDPQLKQLVAKGEITQALEEACEALRPNVTREASLRFDLDAVERKLKFIVAHQ